MQNPLDLKIVQETYYKHNSNRKKTKANRFKRNHFLQLHIILVDGHAVKLSFTDFLEHFIDIFDCFIDLFAVLLSRDIPHIR